MTEKLYDKDAYLKACEAKIINKVIDGENIYIEIDKSIFFPEGGGQPSDLGTIGDATILDVIEKEGIILHRVDKLPNAEVVSCGLDWDRRLDNMQQHCGEHIVSGIILKEYGGNNCGFHLGSEFVTLDIDIKDVTWEMIQNLENKANEVIYNNLPVKIITENTHEDAQKHPLRKKLKVSEDIRIVVIDGIDCVACCGSHPRMTGEIGLIKIIKTESYKGMTRIYIKCGLRALRDYQMKSSVVSNLNKKYSAEDATLLEKMSIEDAKYKSLQTEYTNLKKKFNMIEANKLIQNAKNDIITGILEGITGDDLSNISKLILEQGNYVVLIASKADKKIILAHNGNVNIHCGAVFKEHLPQFNGRGGGGDKNAQASFENEDSLYNFINKIKEKIS